MYNDYINDLKNRYVYDVVKRLPKEQREDIEKELFTLIEDMLNERASNGVPDNKDIEVVLMELGNPAEMARQYRGENRHLIGGEYYDTYLYILKIVLICAGIGLLVANIASLFIQGITREKVFGDLTEGFLGIIGIPFILVQIFAWITITFVLIEKFHVKVDLELEPWEFSKLPQIPNEKKVIKRGESIWGIVFGVICIILFVFAPQLMGAWIIVNGEMFSFPIFNLDIWTVVLPLFVFCSLLGIIRDTVALIIGRYNKLVGITTVFKNFLGLIVTVVIFKVFDIWNPNFAVDVGNALNLNFIGSFDLMAIWNTELFTNSLLGFLALAYVIDSIVAVYYTVRY